MTTHQVAVHGRRTVVAWVSAAFTGKRERDTAFPCTPAAVLPKADAFALRCCSSSTNPQSMQQIWTIIKHDGPNHLVPDAFACGAVLCRRCVGVGADDGAEPEWRDVSGRVSPLPSPPFAAFPPCPTALCFPRLTKLLEKAALKR